MRIRISDKKYALVIRSFVVDLTATQTAQIAYLNRNTINRYFNYFRYQIIKAAILERHNEKISIPNKLRFATVGRVATENYRLLRYQVQVDSFEYF